MRWHLLLITLLALSLFPAAAAGTQCITEEQLLKGQLKAGQLFLDYRAEIRLIGMDAVIGALNQTADSPQLSAIRLEFAFTLQSVGDAVAALDQSLLEDREANLDAVILKFRSAIGEREDLRELREVIRAALRDKDDRLTALRNQAFTARKRLFLDAFDRAVCVYAAVIDGLDEKSYNRDRLRNRLHTLEDFRPKLEQAIDDAQYGCRNTPLFKCGRDADDLAALQQSIRGEFARLRDDIVDRAVEDRQRLSLGALRADIGKLDDAISRHNQTVDTERLSEEFAELRTQLGDAERLFAERDYDAVEGQLATLAQGLERLQQRYRKLTGENP